MGSWNETCILTRLPIFYDDQVRVLHTFDQISCNGRNDSAFTPLTIGLPMAAQYDDYGNYDKVAIPELEALTERALQQNRFYRQVELATSYGNKTIHIAAGENAFFALDHEIAVLFYHDCGVKAMAAEPGDAGISEAYQRSKVALAKLGQQLANLALPESREELDRMVFQLVVDCFGPDKAWPARNLLLKYLYPTLSTLLMHEAAYRALVDETGNQMLRYYDSNEEIPLRSFVGEQLDLWCTEYRDYRNDRAEMVAKLAQTKPEAVVHYSDPVTSDLLAPRNNYLKPLTTPWMGSTAPLVGNFWGAIELEDILAAVPREEIIDALVFQWGRGRLRVDFHKSGTGSQNAETELPRVIFEKTYQALKAQGKTSVDFYNYLHK